MHVTARKDNRTLNNRTVEFDDIQALARFGHGHLKDSHFLLLRIRDTASAGVWLQQEQFTSAQIQPALPEAAKQIAFTAEGLSVLGLLPETLEQFSEEFLVGMCGDESRSRRLGDIGQSAPEHWEWGSTNKEQVHVLLLLYAREGALEEHVGNVTSKLFLKAFDVLHTLPTDPLGSREPFGFADGISQPSVDWGQDQRTDMHSRDTYSNLLALGEVVLGYHNEYGQKTRRPLIKHTSEQTSHNLPIAYDAPGHRDFGGNGTYLVLRQLQQDAIGFWQFMRHQTNGDTNAATELASLMVGRHRNGDPLVQPVRDRIPGITQSQTINNFNFDSDPDGTQCPIGSHIRRSNPRTGDFPPPANNLLSRFVRMLGFKRRSEYEDLVASSRFHRVLRRGRTYGVHDDALTLFGSEKETSADTESKECGLQFVCLAGNILRQFEFIQSAWSISSTFAGMREQRDPLISHRQPRVNGTSTDAFKQADARGAQHKTKSLPEFVTVRGGGYFFMPGLRAIKYLGHLAAEAESTE